MNSPDQAKLRRGAETVRYEYAMFLHSSVLLHEWAEDPGLMHNILLENVLLHARNLVEFFGTTSHTADDIRARHYLTAPHDFALPYSRSIKKRLNKLLAHVSYSRSEFQKPWQVAALRQELAGAWAEFIDRLADIPGREKWFDVEVGQPIPDLECLDPGWIEGESCYVRYPDTSI